jgi:hypothetical protein
MNRFFCGLLGHKWGWIHIREGWGCVEALACMRCGNVPAHPFDDIEPCWGHMTASDLEFWDIGPRKEAACNL